MKPNLKITSLPIAPPTVASLGETFQVSFQGINDGTADATTRWFDYVYLSNDNIFDNSDRTRVNISAVGFGFRSLAPGEIYTSPTRSFTIPHTTTTGNQFLLFVTDTFDSQDESDETDNVFAVPIEIKAPNLTISGTPNTPSSVSLAEAISLEYKVTNNGSVTAPANWSDRFYISDDATLDNSDTVIGTRNTFSLTPLAAGDSYTTTANVFIPNTVETGNKFLLLQVDTANQQGESDETDNLTAIPIQVGAPNLQVSDATVPTFASVGSTVQVEWEVTNNSTVTASANWFDYIYLSDDNTLDNSDTRLATQSAASNTPLAGGRSYTATRGITLPDTEIGNRHLLFIADGNRRQGETDETDNVRAVPIQIGGLAIDDVTVVEGDSGTTNAVFTVTRIGSNTQTATVDYSTADDTATAGQDYVATNGTLTFNPGETTKTITIGINGDTDLESSENFFVNLTNPTNIAITDSQGVGTILVDDVGAVDSEVSLLVDISGSINSNEYNLQLEGYAESFENPDLYNNLISQGVEGQVAVYLIVWAGGNQQQESIGWTLIDSVQTSQDFAKDIRETLITTSGGSRPFSGSTAPGSAINFAVPLFSSNPFEGRRWTIDVSGDGIQNSGANTATARDNAIAAGVDVINGIVIGNSTSLKNFYDNSVIAGTNANGNPAFTKQTTDFNGFKTAVNEKLTAEVTPPPQVSITDVSLLEGNSGTTDFVFDVSLSKANDEVITVDYTTADGTAIAGKDYTATNGTLTFNTGETSKTVTVSVAGENRVELDETFFINLSNVINGDILDAQGEATITNDDEIQLSNNDVDENSANGTAIGDFSATDASDTDSFTYSLLDNAGGRFTLNGNQLQVANGTLLDFESNTSHSVTVRAIDSNSNNFDKNFVIVINDLDETPVVINKPPVANNDTATTDEDNSTTINVLANDTDEDGETLSITAVSGSKGSVTIDGDNIIYNPNGQFESLNAGDTATDTFTYTVNDGNGLTDTATVTVTINGVDEVITNQPPVANNDTATTNQNQAVTISVTDLLANDTDVEGDTLSITSVGNAANGNVALNGNNVLFTPDAGFSGAASFEYTLSDGNETDNAIVSVTVNSLSSVEILGTPGRDTLTGDNTDNIITGFQGRDMLTGNGGSDQFVYNDIRDAGDIITDFELGSDKIVLTELLDSIGYVGSDAIGDGYVSFGSSRGDAFVQIDQDGMGSDFISRPLVLLQGVTEENLSASAENSFIF